MDGGGSVERSWYLFWNQIADILIAIDAQVTALEARVTTLEARVTTLEARVTTLEAGPAYGGMRRTLDFIIGNLGAAYVPLNNYGTLTNDTTHQITTDLAAGTLVFTKPGPYQISINLEMTFTSDNNSSRSTTVRMYDVTGVVAIPNAAQKMYAGAYTAGFTSGATFFVTVAPAMVGHAIRLEIGNGDAFTTATIRQMSFAATSLKTLI